MNIPLRVVTQQDGYGQLGLSAYYSSHEGAEAVMPFLIHHLGDAPEDPFAFTDKRGVIEGVVWTVLTIPLHSMRTNLGMCVVAVHPVKGLAEAKAMVEAGLAKWRPEITPESCGGHGGAPMLEMLNVRSWERVGE
jgi:hypothetical protein